MSPLVSIIIPVYNRENIIVETIECAVNQTYENIEIVICDNKSTDHTWEILQKYAAADKRIKIFQNLENLGPVLNWKACMEKATGQYIKILWSDDLITPNFIAETLPLFDAETAFVMTGHEVFSKEGFNGKGFTIPSTYQKRQVYTTEEYLNDILVYSEHLFPVSPGCALFRADDIRSALVIDIPNTDNFDFKRYGAGNDLLLYLIVASKYKVVKVHKGIEAFYRAHSSSLTMSNNLSLYYEWSRWYFVSLYKKQLAPKFKSRIRIMLLRNPEFQNLYKAINSNIDYYLYAKMFFSKLFTMVNNRLSRLIKK